MQLQHKSQSCPKTGGGAGERRGPMYTTPIPCTFTSYWKRTIPWGRCVTRARRLHLPWVEGKCHRRTQLGAISSLQFLKVGK